MSAAESVTEPRVVCEGLVRHFGDVRAVDGVSFTVSGGEIFGLLGPNGAGKTTCLRMLVTLLQPDAGAATICGFDTREAPEEVRKRVGYQTGDTQLYERLTPVEFLRYFADLSGMKRAASGARIAELATLLDFESYRDRACGTLSTGQKQRVSIARALLHDPPVIILDEPTSGLDIISANFIVEFLEQKRREGHAIVFSTHIMGEAELLCDRIGVIHRGRLQVVDTPEGLLRRTGASSLTRAFVQLVAEADAARDEEVA